MAMIRCGRGHTYDTDVSSFCQECARITMAGSGTVMPGGNMGGTVMPGGNVGGTVMPGSNVGGTVDPNYTVGGTVNPNAPGANDPNKTVSISGGSWGSGSQKYSGTVIIGPEGSGKTGVGRNGTVYAEPGADKGVVSVVGWLVCVKGATKGKDYRLHSGYNRIGREARNDVCIPNDSSISGYDNTSIVYDLKTKKFVVIHKEGRNGTYVNDSPVYAATELKAYDKIELGQSTFVFVPFCGENFSW